MRLTGSSARIVVSTALALLAGCADKAKPDFDKCVAADTAGDLAGAVTACTAAIKADPTNSTSAATATKPRR